MPEGNPNDQEYKNKVLLKNTENSSVKATLETLEKIGNLKFEIV